MKTSAFRIGVLLFGALAGPARAGAAPPSAGGIAIEPAVTLGGKPFPEVAPYVSALQPPRRIRFVAAAPENGDGSEARPWNNLQAALCDLVPGDRLDVRSGTYPGGLRIDGSCRNGKAGAMIQVFFGPKTIVEAARDAPALVIRRAHWRIDGLGMRLGDSPRAGVSIEGAGAHDVILEGARLSGGAGPSVAIGAETAQIEVANARISKTKLASAAADSVGVRIEAGARNVTIRNSRLHENPAGSIRVDAAAAGVRPASSVEILGNTIHEDGATAVDVGSALGVRIENNTLFDLSGRAGTRGIALGSVFHAVVRSNSISRFAVGAQVGRADSSGLTGALVQEAWIDHNLFENDPAEGVAIDLEAGRGIRVVNNILDGYADGILLLGIAPTTQKVIVANNLVLRFSRMAFVLGDPSAASLFDFNVFSPEADAAGIEVGGKGFELESFLKGGHMPHSRLVRGVRILDRDLSRIVGVETVDRGKPVPGIDFAGRAPDLGVAER